jgi:hypothetical protein
MTVPSSYAFAELARIAYLESCRELSDRARGEVSTYGRSFRPNGALVEEASRLVSHAQELMRLAVAAERAASVSWETIGETLEMTRQSAHERYAAAVEDIFDGILFPTRESGDGRPGWWACPDGLENPHQTVERLDAWALRHREQTDPDRGVRPVSENLRCEEELVTVHETGALARLASRVASGDLPVGVSDRTARRILLERKLGVFQRIADRDPALAQDARAEAQDCFEQLVTWHHEDLESRLTFAELPGRAFDAFRFLLDGRPLAELAFTVDLDPDATGWFLSRVDPARPDDILAAGDPWPIDAEHVDVDALITLGTDEGRDAMLTAARATVERSRYDALLKAIRTLRRELAGDLAKGA